MSGEPEAFVLLVLIRIALHNLRIRNLILFYKQCHNYWQNIFSYKITPLNGYSIGWVLTSKKSAPCENSIFLINFTTLLSRWQQMTNWYISYFFQKIGFVLWKLSPQEVICMKCQSLFSGKKKIRKICMECQSLFSQYKAFFFFTQKVLMFFLFLHEIMWISCCG